MARTKPQNLSFLFFAVGLAIFCAGCRVSKSPKNAEEAFPLPDLERPAKEIVQKDTLVLKPEELKLTHVTQVWKLNSIAKPGGAEKYMWLQKKFTSPFQFNGWVSLDRVEFNNSQCVNNLQQTPQFFLEDDHGGRVEMKVGEKIPVSLEKLYTVKGAYFNETLCRGVSIQFGILYGYNE